MSNLFPIPQATPGGNIEAGLQDDGTIWVRINADVGWLALLLLPENVDDFAEQLRELAALARKTKELGSPTPTVDDHCAVCNHLRWRHHDGVCTEYVDCECKGTFVEAWEAK